MRTSDIKSVFLSAFALFGMFSAFTLGYSAVISNLPSQVGTGSGLTSEEWNKIVGGISALDTGLQNATDKLANFSFSNGKIGIGVTNPTHGLQVSNGMKAKSVYVGMANDFSDRNGTNDNVYIREPANTS